MNTSIIIQKKEFHKISKFSEHLRIDQEDNSTIRLFSFLCNLLEFIIRVLTFYIFGQCFVFIEVYLHSSKVGPLREKTCEQ